MRSLLRTVPAGLLTLVLVLASCEAAPTVRNLRVGAASFQTEVVNTPETRARGLMGRTSLTDEQAMLFVFPDEDTRVFWMKDTPTALSIAYINKQGVVKEILDMQPFSLAPVASRHAVPYALEVVQGAFERRGVHVGDQVNVDDLKGLSADR